LFKLFFSAAAATNNPDEKRDNQVDVPTIIRHTHDGCANNNNNLPVQNNVVVIENNTPFQSLKEMIENAEIVIECAPEDTKSASTSSSEPARCVDFPILEHFAGMAGNTQEVNQIESTSTPEHDVSSLSEQEGSVILSSETEKSEDDLDIVTETEVEVNRINDEANQEKQYKRKRVTRPEKWKSNVRKTLCQSGKEYMNARGKKVAAKKIINKKDCSNACKFKCSRKIGNNGRRDLFQYYYSLNQNEKYVFLKETTEKYVKSRRTTEQPSRRTYSFKYFFKVQEHKIQVCKQFFLGTLNTSQKPIYTVHSLNQNQTAKKDLRGKTGTRTISNERKQVVIDHISKFEVIESHYCRENSKRKYLEATLTIPKMYNLYLKHCEEHGVIDPVKISMYRRIFCTNFNYSFHKPKKDVCEQCSNYYLKKREKRLNEIEETNMTKHLAEKEAMRKTKNDDKKNAIPVLSFDLENVITCPRSFIGNHFYLPKLTIYNLTGHLSTTNKGYCAIWTETVQGRSGNCLASAFRKIVERVLEDNNVEELITWSDSCVPQNRNSHIAFCVLDIMRNYPALQSVTMKYSIPGHGAVQEVDNIHSQIERHMSNIEFFSPLSFVKELKKVNKKHPFLIMQMRDQDFKNYEECSKQLKYENVPFTKVSTLKFTNNDITQVAFKKSHLDEEFLKVSISTPVPVLTRRRSKKVIEPKTPPEIANLIPQPLPKKKKFPKKKSNL
jgi:hypothetical protein